VKTPPWPRGPPAAPAPSLTYRYDAPFHLVLRIEFLEAGGSNVIGFFLQPETADSVASTRLCGATTSTATPGAWPKPSPSRRRVLDEDLAIQTAFDRLVLPLERTTSCIRRADRSTLELRRVLAELVEAAEAG